MEKGKAALPSSVLTAQDTERATEAEPPGRFLRGELMLRCPSEAGGRGGREASFLPFLVCPAGGCPLKPRAEILRSWGRKPAAHSGALSTVGDVARAA